MASVIVREVYQDNLVKELDFIMGLLVWFPYVSRDTEFPGTVFSPGVPFSALSPPSFYRIMKKNIDATKLIQVGLTLSDADGNLPTLTTPFRFVWQFNFRDFDHEVDLHNPDSISLLRRRGIDFLVNKTIGIDSKVFASVLLRPYLGPIFYGRATWITFHGSYDFGYLIKILTGRELPEDVGEFLSLVKRFFGPRVYDLKSMIGLFGLHGGLERVAKSLNIGGEAAKSLAGSGSLLAMQVFLNLKNRICEDKKMETAVARLNHAIYGLTVSPVMIDS